jgi:hypothetical protein
MPTTTATYQVYPSAAAGISRATSGSTAWSNSAYTELVPANAITSDFKIMALCFMMPGTAAVDTNIEIEIDIATGTAGNEVEIKTIPFVYRIDNYAGHQPSPWVWFVPFTVPANTRLSIRLRQGVTTAITYTGFKIMYT